MLETSAKASNWADELAALSKAVGITHNSGMPSRPIPKGFCPPAQGCDPALSDNPSPLIQPKCSQCATAVLIPLPRKSGGATLGNRANTRLNPNGVVAAYASRGTRLTQGSWFLATLSFVAESLRDSRNSSSKMWLMITRRWRLSFDLFVSLFLVFMRYASRAAHCAVGALQAGTWTGSINGKQRSVDLRLSSSLAVDWPNRFAEKGRSSNESCLS